MSILVSCSAFTATPVVNFETLWWYIRKNKRETLRLQQWNRNQLIAAKKKRGIWPFYLVCRMKIKCGLSKREKDFSWIIRIVFFVVIWLIVNSIFSWCPTHSSEMIPLKVSIRNFYKAAAVVVAVVTLGARPLRDVFCCSNTNAMNKFRLIDNINVI